jgi:RNA-directed DNA polymerase
MFKLQVLMPLAQRLSDQPWDSASLTQCLRSYLPEPLNREASRLAQRLITRFPASVAPDARSIAQTLFPTTTAARLAVLVRKRGRLPSPDLKPPSFRPSPVLQHLSLPILETIPDLAFWLGLTEDQLIRFADLRGLSARSHPIFGQHYRQHLIPKPDGTFRLIEEPQPLMKRLQRRILTGLLNHVPPHPAAHGFRPGHSVLTAARAHAGEQVVLRFDLRHFFASITIARVYGLFRTLGYPPAVARNLAGLTTAITPANIRKTPHLAGAELFTARHLPQGAPTSPALANLAAWFLDVRLSGLARSLNASYTRYADDLIFSGDRRIAIVLMDAVPRIVEETGFRLNRAKTNLMPAHQRQTVTGLTVNQHINLPRDQYDRLRATIHHLSRSDDPRRQDPAFLVQLSGQISWAEQANPHRGTKLRAALARALA